MVGTAGDRLDGNGLSGLVGPDGLGRNGLIRPVRDRVDWLAGLDRLVELLGLVGDELGRLDALVTGRLDALVAGRMLGLVMNGLAGLPRPVGDRGDGMVVGGLDGLVGLPGLRCGSPLIAFVGHTHDSTATLPTAAAPAWGSGRNPHKPAAAGRDPRGASHRARSMDRTRGVAAAGVGFG